MRRALPTLLCCVVLSGLMPAGVAAAQSLPPTPPRDQWFAQNDAQNGKGHWSDGAYVRTDAACLDEPAGEQMACSLAAFKAKPFTVVAFVDTGINPYHQDFRAPDFVHHPSQYVTGYPTNATALPLSFDVADDAGYAAARGADDSRWLGVARNRLYWFPGTRIIGGYSTGAGTTVAPWSERNILDDQGHGTGVASVAAGRWFGSNPNTLIVAVEDLGDASLNWATSQPWIDIVSNSWGNIANLPLGSTAATRNATRRGQTVAFAAGNGASNTNSSTVFPPGGPVEDPCKCKTPDSNPSITSPYGGNSWVLTVGAASPINGQAHWWHSIPVDVSSFGSKWRAASAFGVTVDHQRDFGGTSCATPVTAGVLSSYIQAARAAWGDTSEGQRSGQAVALAPEGTALPATGPLSDGKLTRAEGEEIVTKTAFPVQLSEPEKLTWDYAVRPTTPTYYVYQGYGVVDREAKQRGLKVLFGQEAMPVRTDVDTWMAQVDTARNLIWGNP